MHALPRHKGFTIEVGHSQSAVMPWAGWARPESDEAKRRVAAKRLTEGGLITALGQWEDEALQNAVNEIDKFWQS